MIAARYVDVVRERERYSVACRRLFAIAVGCHDPRHPARGAHRQNHHFVPDADHPGRHRAGKAAEVGVRPVDPLHRKTKRLCRKIAFDIDRLQVRKQRRPCIPRRLIACGRDVVAEASRHRDRHEGAEPELRREFGVVADDAVEDVLGVGDQVDLVDGQNDVPHPEQRTDDGVPLRLREKAFARVHHEHGKVGGRRRHRHVAGVLLVAGRVRDDEGAAVGGEEAPGDVDRDALFAFGFQAVEQQREVQIIAGRAVAAGVARKRPLVVLE